jgi:hypothetical protein
MRHEEKAIRSVADYINAIRDHEKDDELRWYRGHVSATFELVPSIARNPDHLKGELNAIKVFKQMSRPLLDRVPATEWEWIFLMQHHGVPTRLLDWSENPLTALYFALDDATAKYAADDAIIWVMDPVALNKHAGHRHEFPRDILAFDIDDKLEGYQPNQVNGKVSRLEPIAAIGPRNSGRMAAQSGTFTVIHADVTKIDEVADQSHIWRLRIPADAKEPLRDELRLLRVQDFTYFPDLDRVGKRIKEILQ